MFSLWFLHVLDINNVVHLSFSLVISNRYHYGNVHSYILDMCEMLNGKRLDVAGVSRPSFALPIE